MQPGTARTNAARPEDVRGTGVAILAGGLGTRLRSVVSDRPKVLATVHGRPFLAYLLDQVAAAGFTEAVLCTGYRGADLEACLGSCHEGLQLRYSREPQPLGTAGALRHALPLIPAADWLVLNGDSHCDADLRAFGRFHEQHGARVSVVLTHVADAGRYGQVEHLRTGEITAFREKVSGAGPGWINAGIYRLPRRLLAQLPEGRALSLERDCFPAWVGRGLFGYPSEGRFLDIGTPESYRRAEAFFAAPPSCGERSGAPELVSA